MSSQGNDLPIQFNQVEVTQKREKAICYLFRVRGEYFPDVWIPKSLLLGGTTAGLRENVGVVRIPYWLAKEKGLAQ